MISSIKIENLRSLKETPFINLKKMNILLGANSSGKSTFLRSFPLFSQSINKDLRGPISWFDDSLVDFGDYLTAKNKNASDKDFISFSYSFVSTDKDVYFFDRYRYMENRVLHKIPSSLSITISYANDNIGTYINRINININTLICTLSIEDRNSYVKVCIDDKEINVIKWKWNQNTHRGMLPLNELQKKDDSVLSLNYTVYKNILDKINKFCDKRLTCQDRFKPIINSWETDKYKFLDYIQNRVNIISLKKETKKWSIEDERFIDLYNNISLLYVLDIWSHINHELVMFYRGCSYIAPMRAEANRYYRSQGLQVNDIDAYGRNLQEFLSSLTTKQQISYNDFCKTLLGFTVTSITNSGNSSIILNYENGKFNLTDVGFGYSQILPIITKLWFLNNKSFRYDKRRYYYEDPFYNMVLIEQPELHLHPAMQAKIADAFIETCNLQNIDKDAERSLRLIIETHSPTIINRIGRRIREGKIDPDDVNVILFQKDREQKNTELKQITFNNQGQLIDWPYGFFEPND